MPEIQNIFEDMYGNLKNESGLEEIMSAMKELVDQYVGNCKNGGFWRQYADNIMEDITTYVFIFLRKYIYWDIH